MVDATYVRRSIARIKGNLTRISKLLKEYKEVEYFVGCHSERQGILGRIRSIQYTLLEPQWREFIELLVELKKVS